MTDHNEHSEPFERTANRSPEHLTFAAAGERLNISVDAVRMRVRRGRLATIQVNERTFVLWPQPKQANEPRTERTGSVSRSTVQDDTRLVTALEERIASLEQHLTERTEEIRRRDHIIAGLVERVRELPATIEDASQDVNTAPLSDDRPRRAPEPSQATYPLSQTPVSDTLALGWRRWWQRLTGGN